MTQSEVADLLSQIISDEEIEANHAGSWGAMSPRDAVNDGVRKYAVGYTGGHTQITILRRHGLITQPHGHWGDKASLTEKGKKYARALYRIEQDERRALIADNEAKGAEIEWLRRAFYLVIEQVKYGASGSVVQALGALSNIEKLSRQSLAGKDEK